jgi:hypothetical protein
MPKKLVINNRTRFHNYVSDSLAPLKEEEEKILDDYSVSCDSNFTAVLNNLIAFNRKSST